MTKLFHQMLKSKKTVYLVSFYFLGCFLGFLWEILVYWFSHDQGLLTVLFELRGVLHGPWVPIYGVGCVLILLISRIFTKKPFLLFLSIVSLCGIVEYFASWFLELLFQARWWDYSDQFMNINGRIYLAGLLFFGMAGMLVIYFLEPAYRKFFQHLPVYFRTGVCMIMTVLFAIDAALSLSAPNIGIGVLILQ